MIEQFKSHLIQELEKRKDAAELELILYANYPDQQFSRGRIEEIDFCINLIKNTIISQTSTKK